MLTRCGGRGSLGGGVAQQRGNLGGAGGQEAEEQPSSTSGINISVALFLPSVSQCKGSGITHNFIYHFCNVY